MEDQTLNLIIAISSIFTAIGTVSAVIVSLYLARRDRKIRIDISANITRQILLSNPPTPDENEYLSFSITNVGFRDVTIQSVSWEFGIFRKKSFIQIFDFTDPYITKLPAKLKDGDTANLSIKVDDLRKNEDYFRLIYSGVFKNLWFYWFRIKVYTSTGEEFYSRVNKRVRDMFLRIKAEENFV